MRFARDGFHGTITEDIVRDAGVTRGALYHHFTDKEDLFRAVLVEVTAEAIASVKVTSPSVTGRWDELIEGVLSYLDACLDPRRTRIMLIDGPSLFGLLGVVEIADTSRESDWQGALGEAMRDGSLRRLPLEALAHQVTAAVTEAGVYVARSAAPDRARRDSRIVLRSLLEGLRQPPT